MLLDALSAALSPHGLNLLGTCTAAAWDARATTPARELLPGARSVIVVGSAGRELWRAFRAGYREGEHPLDAFVARVLDEGDAVLRAHGVRARRLEAAFTFEPRVDFQALAELAGLGARGPFGLLVHPEHGPWFGLRGAWLVDVDVPLTARAPPPCDGCSAPCVGGRAVSLGECTAEIRLRCPLGVAYEPEQIAYHHDGVRPPWMSSG